MNTSDRRMIFSMLFLILAFAFGSPQVEGSILSSTASGDILSQVIASVFSILYAIGAIIAAVDDE